VPHYELMWRLILSFFLSEAYQSQIHLSQGRGDATEGPGDATTNRVEGFPCDSQIFCKAFLSNLAARIQGEPFLAGAALPHKDLRSVLG
jgi:hypothetical protein